MLVHTVNDTPTLTGSVGTDTTGATGEAHVKRPDGSVVITPVTWADPATGAWSATFLAGDLSQPGYHYLEVQVTFSGGAVQTFALDKQGNATYFLVRTEYA